MPSLGEIFGEGEVSGVSEVSEVFDVSGVDIISGVAVNGTCVCVAVGSTVGLSVAVADGVGVTALWQAAREMIKRSGMIFFMGFYNS
jgi:hypothetical protein